MLLEFLILATSAQIGIWLQSDPTDVLPSNTLTTDFLQKLVNVKN